MNGVVFCVLGIGHLDRMAIECVTFQVICIVPAYSMGIYVGQEHELARSLVKIVQALSLASIPTELHTKSKFG